MADAVSHDQNFKNLIVDYPRDALAFFAPEEAPGPDDDVRIVPARQEQLTDRLGDSYRALDAPLLVEWADGRREAVVFALEEDSDWRRFSPRRLARYCLDIADMYDTNRVVPVTIFLRTAGRAPTSLVLGTERRGYLVFDYLACKLAEMPAERWLDSGKKSDVFEPRSSRNKTRTQGCSHALRSTTDPSSPTPRRLSTRTGTDQTRVFAGLRLSGHCRARRRFSSCGIAPPERFATAVTHSSFAPPFPGTALAAEHQGTAFLAEIVRHDYAANVAALRDIVVAVLKFLQLLPVTAPQPRGPRLHMHIVHMSHAIGVARGRIQQSRVHDVADLEASVIVAVSEGREFDLALVVRDCAELLGEDRVGHPQVLALAAAVGDTQAAAIASHEIVLEVRAQRLNRGRVHGRAPER